MDIHLVGSALRRVTEVPDPFMSGSVALLAIQTNSLLLVTSPFGPSIPHLGGATVVGEVL